MTPLFLVGRAWDAAVAARRSDALDFLRPIRAAILRGKTRPYLPVSMVPVGIDELDDLVEFLRGQDGDTAEAENLSHETTWDRVERQARAEDAARAAKRAARELNAAAEAPRGFQAPRPPHVNLVMRAHGRR